MQVGDLVRWKKTGKISIYLGVHDDEGDVYRFHNDEYGIIEAWTGGLDAPIEQLIEVISESR